MYVFLCAGCANIVVSRLSVRETDVDVMCDKCVVEINKYTVATDCCCI